MTSTALRCNETIVLRFLWKQLRHYHFSRMDPTFSKAMKLLHSKCKDSEEQMRLMLEEAVKKRFGSKTTQANSCIRKIEKSSKRFLQERGDSGGGDDDFEQFQHDDEDLILERNLMVEDLACVVCTGFEVAAHNNLIECNECHSLYHQECHDPPVPETVFEHQNLEWTCANCSKEGKSPESGYQAIPHHKRILKEEEEEEKGRHLQGKKREKKTATRGQ